MRQRSQVPFFAFCAHRFIRGYGRPGGHPYDCDLTGFVKKLDPAPDTREAARQALQAAYAMRPADVTLRHVGKKVTGMAGMAGTVASP